MRDRKIKKEIKKRRKKTEGQVDEDREKQGGTKREKQKGNESKERTVCRTEHYAHRNTTHKYVQYLL